MKKVSILVAQYNPNWEKLKKTIISILIQVNVITEIVIADDGSIDNKFEQLEKLFIANNYKNYKLVSLKENQGTVRNILNGINHCTNQTIKLLSPGDYIYNNDTLEKWIDEFYLKGNKLSFGDAIYYNVFNETFNVVETYHDPVNMSVYLNGKSMHNVQLNYLCLRDHILGASILVDKSCMLKYLSMLDNKVIYGEDQAYRLMVYDGIDFFYYNKPVIWYEYGTGVSTNQSDKWKERMQYDFKQCDRILYSMKPTNWGAKRYHLFQSIDKLFEDKLKIIRLLIKFLFFPDLVYWKIQRKIFPYYTPQRNEVDLSNYDLINTMCKESYNAGY